MNFKVDYFRLNEIGTSLSQKNEELEENLEKLTKIIEELNASWQGVDYDNFKEVSTTYIKNLDVTTQELNYIGEFMKIASSKYQENDNGWANEVKRIADKEEDRHNES